VATRLQGHTLRQGPQADLAVEVVQRGLLCRGVAAGGAPPAGGGASAATGGAPALTRVDVSDAQVDVSILRVDCSAVVQRLVVLLQLEEAPAPPRRGRLCWRVWM
jgi:hypothetical protein